MSVLTIMGASTNSIQDSQVIEAKSPIHPFIYPSQSPYAIQLSLCWESLVIPSALLLLRQKYDLMHLSSSLWEEPVELTATVNFYRHTNILDANRPNF